MLKRGSWVSNSTDVAAMLITAFLKPRYSLRAKSQDFRQPMNSSIRDQSKGSTD